MEKKKLYIIPNQHMDLVWRRCFDRDIQYGGQNFVSYTDIEKIYIDDSIKLCEKYDFYRFSVESVAVLRQYLRRNPEKEGKIAQLIQEKRLYVPFTGNNIVDTNLTMGESIVRNYRQGYHWLKSKFDHVPDGADRNDAFGNSAQMPQIFRKFGVKWTYNVTYSPCTAPYWRGLDGSTVYNVEPVRAGTVGGYPKYRPCPACGGFKEKPCRVCGNRRVDQAYMNKRRFRLNLQENLIKESKLPCYILAGGEEVAPDEDIALWALENRDRFAIEFANFESYKQYRLREIAAVDDPEPAQVMDSPECNCNNTGVYVSRIKVKQSFRRLEHMVYAAEGLAAAEYLRTGRYPWEKFDAVWEKLLFVMFHDAITSTHVDAGYEEVMDAMADARRLTREIITQCAKGTPGEQLWVANPLGVPVTGFCQAVVPKGHTLANAVILSREPAGTAERIRFVPKKLEPFSSACYEIIPGAQKKEVFFAAREGHLTGDAVLTNTSVQASAVDSRAGDIRLENEFYRLRITDRGIEEIYDKRVGAIIARAGEYTVGEWILETDIGSPWATLSEDMRRQPLRGFTRILRHEKTEDAETVTFKVTPDVRQGFGETCFDIRWQVTLARGVDQVLFSAHVHWDTWNHRLRIAFPTAVQGRHLYDIPYGMLEREPYEPRIVLPGGDSDWAGAAGDYPAIHWAGIDGDEGSVALFNRGTPSYQIFEDSTGAQVISLSALRSPTNPTCLHAGADYNMPLFDGMRDAGDHGFAYALKGYRGSLADSTVHADGISFNANPVISGEKPELEDLPRLQSENGWISTVIPSLDRKGLIIRIAEYRGRTGAFTLKLPEKTLAVWETDMKEDPLEELPVVKGRVTDVLRPFEIKTLYLKF